MKKFTTYEGKTYLILKEVYENRRCFGCAFYEAGECPNNEYDDAGGLLYPEFDCKGVVIVEDTEEGIAGYVAARLEEA
jgi:hypothetical protein